MKIARLSSSTAFALCFAAGSALAQVALYEHDNYGGQVFRSGNNVPNLADTGFNDKASSVVVRNGQWQLCSDANFRGTCVTLNPGEYPSLNAMGLNDKVSSLRSTGGSPGPGDGWAGSPPGNGGWGSSGGGGNNQWNGNGYNPNSTVKLTAKDAGHCRLIQVAYGRDLYNGLCGLKQTLDGGQNKFTIRMGNAEPYVFVNRGANWEFANPYGAAQPARFKDMGHNAVFRWGDYRLEVEEDL